MQYRKITREEAEKLFYPDAKLKENDPDGRICLHFHGRKVGPRSYPRLDICLADNEVPIIYGGLPCEKGRDDELCEALFGYRIPAITQAICHKLDQNARVAFVKSFSGSVSKITGITLTNQPNEAQFLLIMDVRVACWETRLVEKNQEEFANLITASRFTWLGEPVRRKTTPHPYRNFFLVPVWYQEEHADSMLKWMNGVYQKYRDIGTAFLDGEPYLGRNMRSSEILSEKEIKNLLDALQLSEEEQQEADETSEPYDFNDDPSASRTLTRCIIDEMYYHYTYVITEDGLIVAPQIAKVEDVEYVAELYEWHRYFVKDDWLVVRIEADWSESSPSDCVKLSIMQKPPTLTYHAKKRAEMVLRDFVEQRFKKRHKRAGFNQKWPFDEDETSGQ